MDTKPPPKSRRALTEEQRGKKRRIDKLKHRENRAENKTRIENIERDASFLRDTIGDLMLQLRQLIHNPVQQQQQHLHALSDQPMSLPNSEPWNLSRTLDTASTMSLAAVPHVGGASAAFYDPAPDPITQHLYAQHIFPQDPIEAKMNMDALLTEICGQQRPDVECRCGRPHNAEVECTERIAVIMAVELSKVSNHTSLRAATAARNPSLPDMLLHHTDTSNPLEAVLSLILRQYDFTHVNSMCGIFFLSYRLLRWRYYPSPEFLADVPAIMRPTQAQATILHPKCIDLLPFPALRNHLCLNQHTDDRHSVDLYMRSLRLSLPPGASLMCKTERGCVELHPEFEMLASDLRNWNIGLPWSDYFPHLRQFLY